LHGSSKNTWGKWWLISRNGQHNTKWCL
jgi:hypothetical protein